MSMLRINLFGSVRIHHTGQTRDAAAPRMVKALLAYLLLNRASRPREVLAEVFWGDQSPEHARSCLNTALWRLRRVLEPSGIPRGAYLITTPSSDVSFNRDSPHWLDVAVFEAAARRC